VTHRAPPMLGQHTAEVLAGTLGKSAAEIEQLKASGVIGSAPG
jgi:crotonobetainyl-CoA:carnitine CoA-transferase CaiB-like acyl-CoA transferase